jgi:uncharacterized iron-regulated membrane protein
MNTKGLIENLSWANAPAAGGWSPLMFVLLAFSLLAITGIGYILWKRKKSGVEPPPPPAHETALAALRQLQALLTADNYLEFIMEVSRILRVYIQDRYGLRAPHRSTEEFLMEASESPELSPADQQLLGEFLRQCDMVKFARRHVALARMQELFETAQRFVEDTTARPRDERAVSLANA